MIKQSIIDKIADYDFINKLNTFINLYEEHEKYRIGRLKCDETMNIALYEYLIVQLLQSILFRSKALCMGWIDSLNSENAICSSLISRAHFELTGTTSYLYGLLCKQKLGILSSDDLIEKIESLNFGTKLNDINYKVNPISAMNLIDEVDKQLNKINKVDEKIFRKLYDHLSEYCHNNLMGMTTGTEFNNDSSVVFDSSPKFKCQEMGNFFQIVNSLDAFWIFYKKSLEIIFRNQELLRLFYQTSSNT